MEGTRTWGETTVSSRKAVFPFGLVLICRAVIMMSCLPGAAIQDPHPTLTLDVSLQLRYQIVMSSLFLISIQKTVSRGPLGRGMGSGGGQEMSHKDRESQKTDLFSLKEKAEGQGSPFLRLDSKDQGSNWERKIWFKSGLALS